LKGSVNNKKWNNGVLEYWVRDLNITPSLQTPIIPTLKGGVLWKRNS
jgi:hypothetical protein